MFFSPLVKLLLLGPGESGKSTIFKVMKLMQNGYTREEKEQFKNLVYMNIISQMKVLLRASKQMEIGLQNRDNLVPYRISYLVLCVKTLLLIF